MARKKEEKESQEAGPQPWKLPDQRLLVEVGCHNCNARIYVKVNPFAAGNQFTCERCGARNDVLLKPYTVPPVRTICESPQK